MDAVLDDARPRGRGRRSRRTRRSSGCAPRTSTARCCASSIRRCAAPPRAGARGRLRLLAISSTSSSGSKSCGSSGRRCTGRCRRDADHAGTTARPVRIPIPDRADDHQPVGAGRASRRRDRRQRARACATCCARGPRVRHLRADDRRRPARRRAAVRRRRRRARGDVTIFHFALPSPMTAGVRRAAGAARAAVPQHHAGALLRALRRRPVPARGARPAGAGDARRRTSTWRSATRSSTGRSSRQLGFAPTGVMPIAVEHRADHRRAAGGPRSRRSSATA